MSKHEYYICLSLVFSFTGSNSIKSAKADYIVWDEACMREYIARITLIHGALLEFYGYANNYQTQHERSLSLPSNLFNYIKSDS